MTEFQSTHPLRGATCRDVEIDSKFDISIHAPLAGCDKVPFFVLIYVRISIHAPLAGCDGGNTRDTNGQDHFNPRTPCGVRQNPSATSTGSRKFQSTHPLRGATQTPIAVNWDYVNFNPRTPCGVRRGGLTARPCSCEFQSTHPLRGATNFAPNVNARVIISIHAPLAGCDRTSAVFFHRPAHFNPRTPCGVRPSAMSSPLVYAVFQSTHPLRGATDDFITSDFINIISIHAPLAGCDARRYRRERYEENFNPRTPCGVRRSPIPS